MIKMDIGEFTEEELQAQRKLVEDIRKQREEDRKKRIYTQDDLERYHQRRKFEEDCDRDATLGAIGIVFILIFLLPAFIFS